MQPEIIRTSLDGISDPPFPVRGYQRSAGLCGETPARGIVGLTLGDGGVEADLTVQVPVPLFVCEHPLPQLAIAALPPPEQPAALPSTLLHSPSFVPVDTS
jgi:hypothetical protein